MSSTADSHVTNPTPTDPAASETRALESEIERKDSKLDPSDIQNALAPIPPNSTDISNQVPVYLRLSMILPALITALVSIIMYQQSHGDVVTNASSVYREFKPTSKDVSNELSKLSSTLSTKGKTRQIIVLITY